jgi:hypothetical protein
MHYIKDVFESKATEHAHLKFTRYSKGVFVGPLLSLKFSKSGIKVKSSFHFVDELLILLAEVLKEKVVFVGGSVVWNKDLTPDFNKLGIKYSKVSKSRGIFKYVLANEVNFKDFVTYFGKYNLLLNIKDEDASLVTKTSPPKPNKEVSTDFCKVSLPLSMEKRVREEFLFDIKEKNFKEVQIAHEILIEDIILPENAQDFEEARRLARRVGLLKRVITIDGQQKISECKFDI